MVQGICNFSLGLVSHFPYHWKDKAIPVANVEYLSLLKNLTGSSRIFEDLQRPAKDPPKMRMMYSAKTQSGWKSSKGPCYNTEKSLIELFHLTFLPFIIKGLLG